MPIRKIWGVVHADDLHQQPESRHLIAEIEREPDAAIEKFGFEALSKDAVFKTGEDLRYWTKAEEAAKRKNAPIVSLEPTERERVLTVFTSFLLTALAKSGYDNWHEFKKLQSKNPTLTKYFGAIGEMCKELESERVTKQRVLEVCLAVAYRRSQKMLEQARQQGVTHLIVSHMHAEDFQKEDPSINPIILGSGKAVGRKYASWEKLRPLSYAKHRKLVGKFEEIARRHFP